MVSIQNVVSTCKIFEKIINLQETAKNIPNSYYTPNKFNAVVIKYTDPKATTMLFNSGRLVCTGAKHMADNKLACEKTAFLLGTHYMSEYTIQNIVGSGCMGKCIDLIGLAKTHREIVQYEVELFPGANVHFPDIKATGLLFTTGKFIITGVKHESALYTFHNKLLELTKPFLYEK